MDNLEALYCHIDDYCKTYTAEQQKKMLTLGINMTAVHLAEAVGG